LIFNTGDRIVRNREGMLATVAYAFNKKQATYALEGSVFVAGAAVQWLRDGLKLIRNSSEIEQLAASVPDSAGVFFVPAFTGLGAPHWDPHARGTILGVTRGTTAAHLARAALEAMVYQSAEVVAVIERASGARIRELRVDGGAAANNLAMQFQADILGVDVVRPAVVETTALGAAYLAGLQAGCWRDIEAISKAWKEEHRFKPSSNDQQRRSRMQQWMRAVERSKQWAQAEPA
jgi:glycerol kinase